ncbi:sulfatase-like hydrolase/transferase [Crateriforma spongiae]|uniref:sulfatase-like hydrolase/transferase n=1 Tax=Crateriforma spongiae TaxID=2724528 RepID=UPI0014485EBF|nr:sulfatase-like hydrolase/transferase [Crateriforma spongiae]
MKLFVLMTLGLFWAGLWLGLQPCHADTRPNFVFILTDDQSYGMMGCDGNERTSTPNLDQLAKDGIFFDSAYVSSAICTPSRISIFLGQFERKHGVNFNSGTSVAQKAWKKSYPVLLRDAGYYTGYVGKNHAPIGDGGYDSGLMEKSFDYFYAGHRHLTFYPKDRHAIFNDAAFDTQVEILAEGATDFLSNEHRLGRAIRFLDVRPTERPFCLSVCFNLPHNAGAGSMALRDSDDEIYKTLYRDQEIPMPPHYVAKAEIKQPKVPADVWRVSDRQTGYDHVDNPDDNRERIIRKMQAMTGIDRMVGQLREKLAELDVDQNTILVFASDHGLFMGEQGLGGKALCYEKVTHIPMMIFNPLSESNARGRRCDELVQTIDLAPTMLDYAGVDVPETMQGKSLRGLVDQIGDAVHDYIFTENLWVTHFGNPKIEAVQDKRWKYIRYYRNNCMSAQAKIEAAAQLGLKQTAALYGVSDPMMFHYRDLVESSLRTPFPDYEELYDLANDPSELNNLAADPKHARQLNRLRKVWRQKLRQARGTEPPAVLRYTDESELERQLASKQSKSGNR